MRHANELSIEECKEQVRRVIQSATFRNAATLQLLFQFLTDKTINGSAESLKEYTIGEKPFVFASRFPNGAISIGIQERTRPDRAWYMPPANVELFVGDAAGPYGVFGSCATLSLVFGKSLAGKRVLAQDLASDEALDVTDHVHIDGQRLQLTAADLRRFGLRSVSMGDLSSPGMVLTLR